MVRFSGKRPSRAAAAAAAQSQPEPRRAPLLSSGVSLVIALALVVAVLTATSQGHSGSLLRAVDSRQTAAAAAAAHAVAHAATQADAAAASLAQPQLPATALALPAAFPALGAADALAPPPRSLLTPAQLKVIAPHSFPADAAALAAAAAPAAAPAPAAATAGAPSPYRGVLNPAQAVRALHWVRDPQDGVVRLRHAVPSAGCPKWLQVAQNQEAGAGHRLRQWSTALWVAATLPPTGSSHVAFAHTSLDVGAGQHGGYPGVDAFLGLRQGEAALDAKGLLAAAAGKGVREFPCSLDFVTDAPYAPNAAMLGKWERRMGNPDDCNVLFTAPADHWAADHSSSTRLLHAWKFAAAAKGRAAAGARLALAGSGAGGEWDPASVHIGLHQRLGDGLLVPEAVLAGITERYVLAEVRAADVRARVVLHVFSEAKAPAAELPALSALAGLDMGPQRGPLAVFFHGPEADFIHTVWSLSQCDFFVGSVSSMSWVVAQFSSRPASLLQSWDGAGEYKWCLEGMGCCDQKGVCNEQARMLMVQTAQRLAGMARSGQLTAQSWEDELALPEPEANGEAA